MAMTDMNSPVPASDRPVPVADLSRAPLPTSQTIKRRASVPFQLTRFAVFNARIMRMVVKGHH